MTRNGPKTWRSSHYYLDVGAEQLIAEWVRRRFRECVIEPLLEPGKDPNGILNPEEQLPVDEDEANDRDGVDDMDEANENERMKYNDDSNDDVESDDSDEWGDSQEAEANQAAEDSEEEEDNERKAFLKRYFLYNSNNRHSLSIMLNKWKQDKACVLLNQHCFLAKLTLSLTNIHPPQS